MKSAKTASISFYGEDLARIHDAGFSLHSRAMGEEVLGLLANRRITKGRVTDLGCGSGIWLEMLAGSGFSPCGRDISAPFVQMARERVRSADLFVGGIYGPIRDSVAVTAFGEVLNYVSDPDVEPPFAYLFDNVTRALAPGGLFVFDVIEPGEPLPSPKSFTEGEDWVVLVERTESERLLERHITTFVKLGELYRRSDEIHYQKLLSEATLTPLLEQAGFEVSTGTKLGDYQLLPRRRAYVCTKR